MDSVLVVPIFFMGTYGIPLCLKGTFGGFGQTAMVETYGNPSGQLRRPKTILITNRVWDILLRPSTKCVHILDVCNCLYILLPTHAGNDQICTPRGAQSFPKKMRV